MPERARSGGGCFSVAPEGATADPNVSVHPNLCGLYRRKVEELEPPLDDATAREDAMTIIRSMIIEGIVLTPGVSACGVEAVSSGDVTRIQCRDAGYPLVLGTTRQGRMQQRPHDLPPRDRDPDPHCLKSEPLVA
ncbi:hypothetical protein [Microvirga antarctica]|uniref:hypothetical protein n=1 Tax=Microvirga antarctica TaxID=2819233 RepID=UPI001B30F77E|nr:hypothetical protein [Microvirga antarctica]